MILLRKLYLVECENKEVNYLRDKMGKENIKFAFTRFMVDQYSIKDNFISTINLAKK